MLKSPLSTRPVIEALEARIAPATFTVTTTADSGPGSLRQAILDANALTGADTIGFAIDGDQLQIISVLSPLPAITDKVTISGAGEKVRIDGTNAEAGAVGLQLLNVSDSIVTQLEIANFSGSSLLVDGGSGNQILKNSFIAKRNTGEASSPAIAIVRSTGNRITENSFAGFTSLPIDLGNDGPTPNDPTDSDTGANSLQNYPDLGINRSSGSVTVDGSLKSDAPNTRFRIELYTRDTATGNIAFLTALEPTSTVDGTLPMNFTLPESLIGTKELLATATNLSTNSTSEFSSALVTIPHAFMVYFSGESSEGQSNENVASFTIRLTEASTKSVTVHFSTGNWTAIAGQDFVAVNDSVVFAPGETTKTITVPIIGDTISEADETFSLSIDKTEGALIWTDKRTSNFTIVDDDGFPTISFQSGFATESLFPYTDLNDYGPYYPGPTIGSGSYTITLDHPSPKLVQVTVSVGGGTAVSASSIDNRSDVDVIFSSKVITFQPGQTSITETFYTVNDGLIEGNENVVFRLSNPVAGTLGNAEGIVTVFDNDALRLQPSSVTIVEGNNGTSEALMTISLISSQQDAPTRDFPVTVMFKTTPAYYRYGSRAEPGSDYTAQEGMLSFEPGESIKFISIPILGDQIYENSEDFAVVFSSMQAQGTAGLIYITNDDLPSLSITDGSISEGTDGSRSLVFTLKLSSPALSNISVNYNTEDGTATAGSDYTAVSGIVWFLYGQQTATISVPISGDTAVEPDEIFNLVLSTPVGTAITTDRVAGHILNDDGPTLSVSDANVLEGSLGTKSLNFTFSLSQASVVPVSVHYATVDATATAGSDYTAISGTLTFAPGETTKTVSVPILGDTVYEADEILSLHFSNVSGASLEKEVVHGAILNDDAPGSLPVLSVANASGVEGNEGNGEGQGIPVGPFLPFTFTLSKASSSPVSVHFATADGTATAGSDYTAGSGIITFAPGETTKTILIPILAESVQETNETLRLLLSEVSGATLAQTEATGTILNDDIPTDAANLVISKGGRMATWTDSDGDLITLKATKPVLALSSFHFVSVAEGDGLVLQELNVAGQGTGASGALGLSFSVKKSATGDGLVHAGAIDASGRDLSTLSLPGRLGWISAGDTNLKTPGIGKLTVDSFGLDSATTQTGAGPMQSNVKGSIGSFIVKHDFTGANLTVSGGSVGSLVIGGSLEGTSAATPSGISIEKNLGTLRVGGDVNHANVITGSGTQAGAHIDQVLVSGNWTASNLVVGAGAGPDGLYGTGDDEALQDSVSRIARITIRGAVSGTAEAENGSDHFGFVAGRIAAFQVGGQKLALTSKWQDSMEVGSTSDVMLRELAGRSRS